MQYCLSAIPAAITEILNILWSQKQCIKWGSLPFSMSISINGRGRKPAIEIN